MTILVLVASFTLAEEAEVAEVCDEVESSPTRVFLVQGLEPVLPAVEKERSVIVMVTKAGRFSREGSVLLSVVILCVDGAEIQRRRSFRWAPSRFRSSQRQRLLSALVP